MKIPVSVLVLGYPDDPNLEPLRTRSDILSICPDPRLFFVEVLEEASVVFATVPDPSALSTGISADAVTYLIDRMPQLTWIHAMSVGVNHLLSLPLVESDVVLTNARGIFLRSLAEYCLLGMLYFAKDVARLRNQQERRQWCPFTIEELHGKVVGVVGYGDIGKAVARMAKTACGVRVLAFRRNPRREVPDGITDAVYAPDDLLSMVEVFDFVVCAAPETPETIGLISASIIGKMKRGCVVINIGRGSILDEDALAQALRERRIRGAVLDVTSREPPDDDSPLFHLDNVLLSPHNADQTKSFKLDSTNLFLELLEEFNNGETLRNQVDKSAGY